MQFTAVQSEVQRSSHVVQNEVQRNFSEGRIKPVKSRNLTSRELQNSISNVTLKVIKTRKNNNLIHVLNDNEQQEYINYIKSLRQTRGESEMSVNQTEETLNIQETAQTLQRTVRQVYAYIKQGRLVPVEARINGRKRKLIPLHQVEDLKAELGIPNAPGGGFIDTSPELQSEVQETSRELQNEEVCSSCEVQEPEVTTLEPAKEETKYLVDVWAEVDRRIAQAVQQYVEKVDKLEVQNKVLLERLKAVEEHGSKVDEFITEWREDKRKKENRPFWRRWLGI